MPLFRVQVFKSLSGSDREWSNTYLVDAADLDAAVTAAAPIPTHEQPLHGDVVTITRMRVSDTTEDTDVFASVPLGLIGTLYTAADHDWMPLFNTVRVDIGVVGGGRPSRKFYRPPIAEDEQVNGRLNASIKTLFDGTIADMISDVSTAGGTLVDPDGQLWITPSTQLPVQMRQLHRKRKKTTPAP